MSAAEDWSNVMPCHAAWPIDLLRMHKACLVSALGATTPGADTWTARAMLDAAIDSFDKAIRALEDLR